jgi:hypothetical protein
MAMAEEQSKFVVDGKEVSQARYKVLMEPGKEKVEFLEVDLSNGRKAVDSFASLTRDEAIKLLGQKNIEKIEKGVGADKDTIVKDASGVRSAFDGRLEKRALEPYVTSSIGLEQRRSDREVDQLVNAVRDLASAKERVSKLIQVNQPEQSPQTQPARVNQQLHAELDGAARDKLAIEGAKDLAAAGKLSLAALNAKAEDREPLQHQAGRLELHAYDKLAVVSPERARELVTEEQRAHFKDNQLLASTINFHPQAYQNAVDARQQPASNRIPALDSVAKEFSELKRPAPGAAVEQTSTDLPRPGNEKAVAQAKEEREQPNTIEQFDKGRLMDAEVRRNLEHLNRVKNAELDANASNLSKSRNGVQNIDAMADYSEKPSATKQAEKQVDENIRKIPDEIEKKYIKVGDTFHYMNKPDLKAFEDRGNKLETKSNSEHVAADLVNIAKARGWEDIKVNGTEEFRRQVWLEASARGMGVKGYQPKEADLAMLEKRNKDAKTNSIENADQRVKDRQENKTTEKAAAPRTAERDDSGAGETAKEKAAKEKADAIRENNRTVAAKKYPELVGALAVVAAGEKFAKENLKTTSDRMRFNELTRETIAKTVEKGDKLPEIKVKDVFQEKAKPDQVLSR